MSLWIFVRRPCVSQVASSPSSHALPLPFSITRAETQKLSKHLGSLLLLGRPRCRPMMTVSDGKPSKDDRQRATGDVLVQVCTYMYQLHTLYTVSWCMPKCMYTYYAPAREYQFSGLRKTRNFLFRVASLFDAVQFLGYVGCLWCSFSLPVHHREHLNMLLSRQALALPRWVPASYVRSLRLSHRSNGFATVAEGTRYVDDLWKLDTSASQVLTLFPDLLDLSM